MRKMNVVLALLALLAVFVPSIAAQDDDMMMHGPDVIITLGATPLAENVGLQGVTGWAHFNSDAGTLHITLEPNGATLPEGTVLEGWVVDAGLNGGPGTTNTSDADETFGTSFGDADFDTAVESAPYALSTGVLTENMDGNWEVVFEIPNYNFSPYDAVVVTAESDANSMEGFDPRPGAPVFSGLVADGEDAMMDDMGDDMSDESMDDDDMSDDMSDDEMGEMDMMDASEITLAVTPLAANAGLGGITGTAYLYSDSGMIEITVNLNGAALPEGSVLEGWVVDAGLNGGPGTTNASDADEAFGTSFDNADFDAAVESAPYALSTGVLYDNMDGTVSLSFYVPAYNFSPYDAVVITLESDGNTTDGFDPRPGTPVLSGEIDHMMGGM